MQPTQTDRATVRFKKILPTAITPEFQTTGAAGFDLAVHDTLTVGPRCTERARTGLAVAIPPGTMLLLAPRSSTWSKWGLRIGNTVGVVDQDYCGDEDELLLSLWNPTVHARVVPAGTRIAQGIIVPVLNAINFTEVETLGADSRGGWGSTG